MISSPGTDEPRSFPACSVPVQLSTLGSKYWSAPELVYSVGHGVRRIFQTPSPERFPENA